MAPITRASMRQSMASNTISANPDAPAESANEHQAASDQTAPADNRRRGSGSGTRPLRPELDGRTDEASKDFEDNRENSKSSSGRDDEDGYKEDERDGEEDEDDEEEERPLKRHRRTEDDEDDEADDRPPKRQRPDDADNDGEFTPGRRRAARPRQSRRQPNAQDRPVARPQTRQSGGRGPRQTTAEQEQAHQAWRAQARVLLANVPFVDLGSDDGDDPVEVGADGVPVARMRVTPPDETAAQAAVTDSSPAAGADRLEVPIFGIVHPFADGRRPFVTNRGYDDPANDPVHQLAEHRLRSGLDPNTGAAPGMVAADGTPTDEIGPAAVQANREVPTLDAGQDLDEAGQLLDQAERELDDDLAALCDEMTESD